MRTNEASAKAPMDSSSPADEAFNRLKNVLTDLEQTGVAFEKHLHVVLRGVPPVPGKDRASTVSPVPAAPVLAEIEALHDRVVSMNEHLNGLIARLVI